jgi:hypothetical protein
VSGILGRKNGKNKHINLVNQSLTETENDSRLRNPKSPVSEGPVTLKNFNSSGDPNIRRSAAVDSTVLASFN